LREWNLLGWQHDPTGDGNGDANGDSHGVGFRKHQHRAGSERRGCGGVECRGACGLGGFEQRKLRFVPFFGKWRTGGGERAGGAAGGRNGYLDGQFHAREYGFVHERGGHHECDGVGFRSGDAGGDGLQRYLFDWRLWQPVSGAAFGSGTVLVSVSASTSGMLVFAPATGGGLQLSCFNYVRPQFVQDGASAFGMNLTPNGQGLAATLGVDGAIFYNLSTLQTCTSTGLQVSQGLLSADEGSFDVVMSPDGKYAFVANEYGVAPGATAGGNVGVVALQYDSSGIVLVGTLVGEISTGGQTIAGVAISPDGSRLYATSEVEGSFTNAAGGAIPS
jgi:hypothetical protein